MATLLQLCDRGELEKLDPQLPEDEYEARAIYLLPRSAAWIRDTLPTLESRWIRDVSPQEQLQALLEIWAAGEELVFDWQFKPLVHHADGIWEIKTGDLRAFGWFSQQDIFICSAIFETQVVKDHELYHGASRQAARDRDLLDLDEPKFIAGDQPSDVVKNFSFPPA